VLKKIIWASLILFALLAAAIVAGLIYIYDDKDRCLDAGGGWNNTTNACKV